MFRSGARARGMKRICKLIKEIGRKIFIQSQTSLTKITLDVTLYHPHRGVEHCPAIVQPYAKMVTSIQLGSSNAYEERST